VNREMVKAIIALGNGIGSGIIAEGIHTEDEARALQDMGVDWGPGYLLARPDSGPE
jgi:EAL domain-containing protein (putative c-di-GMP-specific phosphodiesterase class I)